MLSAFDEFSTDQKKPTFHKSGNQGTSKLCLLLLHRMIMTVTEGCHPQDSKMKPTEPVYLNSGLPLNWVCPFPPHGKQEIQKTL